LSLPNRIAAYDDCLRLFDEAVSTGARAAFKTFGEANITLRMHQARALLREENQRLYERHDPSWGKTDYDHLVVKKPVRDDAGDWWVYIQPAGSNILTIEKLQPGDAI
jgi:hypothetical protein